MKKISVGICAYNEEKNIGRILKFLGGVKIPGFKIIEIIVVASGCEDRTVEIVKELMKVDKRIRLIVQKERRGKASALNIVLRKYRGDFLLVIDADVKTRVKSISLLLRQMRERVGVVTGRAVPIGNKSVAEKLTRVLIDLYYFSQQYFIKKRGFCCVTGELFVVRRGICNRIPKDIVNDDTYIGVMCKLKNYKIILEEKAEVYFKSPMTMSDLISRLKRFLYGHFKIREKTGISPPVLSMNPIREIKIFLRFVRKRWHEFPYIFLACIISLYVILVVKIERLKKENPYKIWKIAYTTKFLG